MNGVEMTILCKKKKFGYRIDQSGGRTDWVSKRLDTIVTSFQIGLITMETVGVARTRNCVRHPVSSTTVLVNSIPIFFFFFAKTGRFDPIHLPRSDY